MNALFFRYFIVGLLVTFLAVLTGCASNKTSSYARYINTKAPTEICAVTHFVDELKNVDAGDCENVMRPLFKYATNTAEEKYGPTLTLEEKDKFTRLVMFNAVAKLLKPDSYDDPYIKVESLRVLNPGLIKLIENDLIPTNVQKHSAIKEQHKTNNTDPKIKNTTGQDESSLITNKNSKESKDINGKLIEGVYHISIYSAYYFRAIPGFVKAPKYSRLSLVHKCNRELDFPILKNDLPDRDIFIHPRYLLRHAATGIAVIPEAPILQPNHIDSLTIPLAPEPGELLDVCVGETCQKLDLATQGMTITIKTINKYSSYLILQNARNEKGDPFAPLRFGINNMHFLKNSAKKPSIDNNYACDELKSFNPRMQREFIKSMQLSGILRGGPNTKNGSSDLIPDVIISGIKFKNGKFRYDEINGFASGTLAEDTLINKVWYHGDTKIFFDDTDYFSFFVRKGCPKENIVIDGVEYKACNDMNEYIRKRSEGKMFVGTLAKDTAIDGVTYKAESEIVYFNSGAVSSGHVKDAAKVHGVTIPPNSLVRFFEEGGGVMEITIYDRATILGEELEPFTPCGPFEFHPVISFTKEGEPQFKTNENAGYCE